jgi:hypothetical protein
MQWSLIRKKRLSRGSFFAADKKAPSIELVFLQCPSIDIDFNIKYWSVIIEYYWNCRASSYEMKTLRPERSALRQPNCHKFSGHGLSVNEVQSKCLRPSVRSPLHTLIKDFFWDAILEQCTQDTGKLNKIVSLVILLQLYFFSSPTWCSGNCVEDWRPSLPGTRHSVEICTFSGVQGV